MREEPWSLEDKCGPTSLRWKPENRPPVHLYVPGIGSVEPGHQTHERALSRAGGPEQRDATAGWYLQIEPAESGGLRAVELPRKADDPQCVAHRRTPRRATPSTTSRSITGGSMAATDAAATRASVPLPDASDPTTIGAVTNRPPPTTTVTM